MEMIRKIERKGKAAVDELAESQIGRMVQGTVEDITKSKLGNQKKIGDDSNNAIVPKDTQFTSMIPGFSQLKSYYDGFSDFIDDWNEKSPEEKTRLRDEINTKTLLDQAEELPPEESSLRKLTRGTFLIARVLWDKKGEKSHDHLCFVDWVNGNSINMIFITDIFEPSDKPKTKTWKITDLNAEIRRGNLKFVKFPFGGLEDEHDLIMERALAYRIPEQEVRSLHFAYMCAFGLKEPVFSAEHLSLCDNKTLLMLRTEEEEKMVLLNKARKNKFHIVSSKNKTEDVMTYEELASMTGAKSCAIYYYPNVKVESLDEIFESKGGVGHDVVHNTVEVGAIHLAEHGVKDGVKLFAPELAGTASHAFGGALHGVIASIGAGIATNKARNKEKVSKDTHGLKGYSRTRGNKEISAAWSSAAVGTGATIAGSMGTAALIGQLAIPIPGIGLAIGVVAGGVIAGITASYVTKKSSKQIYDMNIERKCPLGECH